MTYPDFKVCVMCFTFNQPQYITDALNGFAKQRTDFPFVCCVVDDASTNGAQAVISSYMADNFLIDSSSSWETDYAHITYARHKTNGNCFFAVLYLKENLYSKGQDFKKIQYLSEWREKCLYEAWCGGDDFWIDSDKLQKQCDFLDTHADYSLCFSNVKILDESTGKYRKDKISRNAPQTSTIEELSVKNYIYTPSALFRMDYSIHEKIDSMGKLYLTDYPMRMMVAEKGKLYKFSREMAVYRQSSGEWSVTSYTERVCKTIIMLCKLRFFISSDSVRELLDRQIEKYKQDIISEYNSVNEKLRKARVDRRWHLFAR